MGAQLEENISRVAVGPGVFLQTLHWSDPSHDTVCVLIHGSAEGAYVWNDFASALSIHCDVLAIDLRGHGDSDHNRDATYSLEQHVGDVARVLDQVAASKIILVGHSLGGDIAARIAPGLEGRLSGLVIVDTGPSVSNDITSFVRDQLRESLRVYDSVDEYTDWLAASRVLADRKDLASLATGSLRACQHGGFQLKFDPAVIDMITAEHDDSWWLPSLASVRSPVMIVRGMGSAALSRSTAALLVQTARDGRLAVVPAAGHAVMNDNPAGFQAAVLPFVIEIVNKVPSPLEQAR